MHEHSRKREQQRFRIRIPVSLCALFAVLVSSGCSDVDETNSLGVTAFHAYQLPADNGRITAPRAVHVGPNNEIYVLDDNGRVVVLGDEGRVIRQWRMPASDIGRPEGICFLKDGRIVVADTHYDRLVFFSPQGRVLSYQGEHGDAPGQFVYPVAVCQDEHEFIYVAEYGKAQRVQKFKPDGTFVCEFGTPGTEPGQFQRPSGVVWRDGKVYVVDAFNNRMQVFNDDGTFVGVVDDKETDLQYPYDITKAPDGSMYVVEHKAGRVSHLTADGKLIGRYGSSGRTVGHFVTPWGIAFRGKSRVVVADTGNRRVVELEL